MYVVRNAVVVVRGVGHASLDCDDLAIAVLKKW